MLFALCLFCMRWCLAIAVFTGKNSYIDSQIEFFNLPKTASFLA